MIATQERPSIATQLTGDRRVRVIGSGSREDALLRLVWQSPQVSYADISPGNAGTHEYNVPIPATDIKAQVEDAKARNIDLIIVGPEDPLALGIRDQMNTVGIDVFGPTAKEATIESSKWLATRLMRIAGVIHPPTEAFFTLNSAQKYIKARGYENIVVKEDVLLGGKGVTVPYSQEAVDIALGNAFGEKYKPGNPVLVQNRVYGTEVSYMVIVDGEHIVPLLPSKDYKRVGEGDTGLNTGGMGAIAPSPTITPELNKRILKEIMHPMVSVMKERGMNYQGILYAGLMIDQDGNPTVLEFNCRGGDPEFPVISTLFTSDFDIVDVADSVRNGTLHAGQVKFLDGMVALGIVVASEGYPQKTITGRVIEGLDQALKPHSFLFQAGTKQNENGSQILTSGGRVALGVGRGRDFNVAGIRSRKVVQKVAFPGRQLRRDIGKDEVFNLQR